jgi:hypothetical protein
MPLQSGSFDLICKLWVSAPVKGEAEVRRLADVTVSHCTVKRATRKKCHLSCHCSALVGVPNEPQQASSRQTCRTLGLAVQLVATLPHADQLTVLPGRSRMKRHEIYEHIDIWTS